MIVMSTEAVSAASIHDLWLRFIIVLLATISVIGTGFGLRNSRKSSDLQLRLVRASELTTHLKGMNLAAAVLRTKRAIHSTSSRPRPDDFQAAGYSAESAKKRAPF